MITLIKKWSYNKKLLDRKSKIRLDNGVQINMGRKIAILYEIEDLHDHTIIHEFKQRMKADGRIVKTLSYIDQKIDVGAFSQKTFSKKEIQWDGTPTSPYIEEFLDWDADLLICPIKNIRDCFTYIIELSSARLKIGLNSEEAENLYDLIIDIPYVRTLDEILNEILKQLKTVSH